MLLLYNITTSVLSLLTLPYLLLMVLLNRQGMTERLSLDLERVAAKLQGKGVIWLQAASVGEVSAVAPLVHTIRKIRPELAIFISTTTTTGLQRAKEVMEKADAFSLLPLDLPFVVRRAIKRINPEVLLLTETELWPNLILQAKSTGCRIAVVNGRLTERSLSRYRIFKGFWSRLLKQIDLLCVQSNDDLRRYSLLGAVPERIVVTGSMKFDVPKREQPARLETDHDRQVIVAGSVREGEEEILIDVFKRLRQNLNDLLLIMAPRHLQRVKKIESIVLKRGLSACRRSQWTHKSLKGVDVLILDTIGELPSTYALADVAFVGGSLAPFGGHNPLEPASHGVPVVFGPYMEQEGTKALLEKGAAFRALNGDELFEDILQLLKDPELRQRMGEAGKRVVEDMRGASRMTAQLLRNRGLM